MLRQLEKMHIAQIVQWNDGMRGASSCELYVTSSSAEQLCVAGLSLE